MLKILSLPDDLRDWQGTAAQLATKLNELLPAVGLEHDAGSATERLVRYYVSAGILTEPESRGRERMFGFMQIVEFLVARQLVEERWPLAKIKELVRSSVGIEGLLALGSPSRSPTSAERALASIHEQLEPYSVEPVRSADSLERAAGLSLRRSKLREDLKTLGNPSGRAHRRRVLRLSLTPWCQVLVDSQHLKSMDASTPQILGDALASVLEEERLLPGE